MRNSLFYGYLLLTIAMVGCKAKGNVTKEEDVQAFSVITVEQRDTTINKGYVTTIEAIKNVEIRAKVNGFIEKIWVDEGQPVKQGQLLFTINNPEFAVQLAKARASVSLANAELRTTELELVRVKTLVDKNVLTKSEIDLADAKIKAAKAKLAEAHALEEEAQIHLSLLQIKAPFSGSINRIPLKLGSLVEVGSLLTTASDLSDVYAYFHVSENEYLNLASTNANLAALKKSVTLKLADGTDYKDTGIIETMEGEFDQTTGAIAFRAKFPNDAKLLKHGSTGSINITSREDDAILVPQKSIMEIQDRQFVFVMDASNKVSMRGIETSSRIDEFFLLKSGLKPGDKIVYEGVMNIKEGAKIAPKMITLESVLNSRF
ncbi:efflux RND transporter periplasmic adaptor subunit [Polluticaenibacter yanchengensis]|uniref:Efflux RND transporter periplasmic adaptor subunit n=1 Tax=Polluticaenibacter yanchengensis TaxID=3014562 RepID=A0ABT4UID6_9BACT|nr:efflux RND transporter periplasmic adaptor subunit [Chitinophagaceae bacterium LY-5]